MKSNLSIRGKEKEFKNLAHSRIQTQILNALCPATLTVTTALSTFFIPTAPSGQPRQVPQMVSLDPRPDSIKNFIWVPN